MITDVKEKEIIDIMAHAWNLDPGEIPADIKFNDFPFWDSLGHVTLLLGLEKEYKIAIDYKVVTELVSIPAILDYLRKERDV